MEMTKILYDYIRKGQPMNDLAHYYGKPKTEQSRLYGNTTLSGVGHDSLAYADLSGCDIASPSLSSCCDMSVGINDFQPVYKLPPSICEKCNKKINLDDKTNIIFHYNGDCVPKSKFKLNKDDDNRLQNLVDLKIKEIKTVEHSNYIKWLADYLDDEATKLEKEALANFITKMNGMQMHKDFELAKAFRLVSEHFLKSPPPAR